MLSGATLVCIGFELELIVLVVVVMLARLAVVLLLLRLFCDGDCLGGSRKAGFGFGFSFRSGLGGRAVSVTRFAMVMVMFALLGFLLDGLREIGAVCIGA